MVSCRVEDAGVQEGSRSSQVPEPLNIFSLDSTSCGALDMALRPKKLAYSIAGVSSVSADYSPERIIVDNPTDTRSRWSAHQHAGARTRQWVLLELVDEPAIISKSLTIHGPGPIDLSSPR